MLLHVGIHRETIYARTRTCCCTSIFTHCLAFLGNCEGKTEGGRSETNEMIITKNHQHKIYVVDRNIIIYNDDIRVIRGLLPCIVLR